ncbi:hypothetical protein ZMTM_06320 [Methyloradius palustris]|uniref:DUF4153 domain-containing protein n=1 Tax=Methyloradius palustris TaxID=2778876 RepID=A0A8D5K039_9PROT|nr:hypothetical protein ZMTM_06320 [Methyloradius palustris]
MQGVSHLWKTGYATALMLSLLGLMVFLFNAAWQNGADGLKLPAWLRILVNLALFSMPVFIALSAYAMNLRVVQYGWTVERVWAAIIIGLTSLYAVGYAISVFFRSNGWMHHASKVNVIAAWLIALVLLLTHTPVLDPIRISVDSQVQRLLTKVTPVQSFDFEYLRFQGGYYGNGALNKLVILRDHPQFSEINQKATQALVAKYKTYGATNHNEPENQADLVKLLHIYPSGSQVPAELLTYLWGETQSKSYWINCLRISSGCQALLIDLNGDAENELVIFDGYNTVVFSQQDRQWKRAGHLRGRNWHQLEAAEVEKALKAGSVAVVDSKWRELKVLQDTYTLEPQ